MATSGLHTPNTLVAFRLSLRLLTRVVGVVPSADWRLSKVMLALSTAAPVTEALRHCSAEMQSK